jgi:hypothetical protein
MVGAMKAPNLERLRTGDPRIGSGLNPFNRSTRSRNAELGTWWERVLAILSLIFVLSTLIGLLIRNV